MSQEKPYLQLLPVLESMRDGKALGFHASLTRIVQQMELDLNDIADGVFNNLRIQDSNKPGKLELALQPVLTMAAAVSNAISDAQGAQVVDISPDDRDQFNGETSIDLITAERQLIRAVSLWIDTIDRHPTLPISGLPLADNHGIRTGEATNINRLSDVLTLKKDGWHPKSFRTNEDSQAALENAAVAGHAMNDGPSIF